MFLALALVVAACTRSESNDTTTTEPATTSSQSTVTTEASPTGGDPVTTLDQALGGTQAVQDFAVYVGVWAASTEGAVSLYDQIVERAVVDAGPITELQGGWTFEPSNALAGHVVDADGEVLPTLSADFGLLDIDPGFEPYLRDAYLADLKASGVESQALLDAVFPDEPGDGRLVVEIVSADYEQARTHAGPGDRTVLDLGFLGGLNADSEIGVAYVFGQTLPGDPAIETGMAPHDLFVYRWNQGLIRMLGGEGGDVRLGLSSPSLASAEARSGPSLAAAPPGRVTLTAASLRGPEPARKVAAARQLFWAEDDSGGDAEQQSGDGGQPELTHLVKELVLANETLRAAASVEEKFQEWNKYRTRSFPGSDFYVDHFGEFAAEVIDVKNQRIVYVSNELALEMLNARLRDNNRVEGCEGLSLDCMLYPDEIIGVGDLDRKLRELALELALDKCTQLAAAMNRQNEAASSPSETTQSSAEQSRGDNDEATGGETDTGGETGTGGGDGDPKRPPPLSCPPWPGVFPPKPPSGVAYGDIHVNTVDGKHYANQAVGEFLLFDNGVAEIQIRTEPWHDDSSLNISVATAFAARLGDHEVSMHADGSTWIDDERADLERGQTITIGDGELLWWDQGWVLLWPDGTVLRAQITAASQLAKVTPATGASIGLLGNFDGDPDNDFFTRGGELLDPDLDDDFEAFYDSYVDSWRITDDESAFHYEDGESTATFVDADFPSRPASPDALSSEARAGAEDVCRRSGVTNEQMFADCVLDVGTTGEPSFAYQAFSAQQATPEPGELPTPTTEPPSEGGDNVVAFGDIRIRFGPNPPVVDPSGPAPKWTCQSSDGVFTAISSFTESALVNYELDIQYIAPDNPRGLNEAFRLIVRRNSENYVWVQTIDQQFSGAIDSVVIDGNTLSARGGMYVNDPPTPGLGPVSVLPDGAELTAFTLEVACG
jgi:hypothetical protein